MRQRTGFGDARDMDTLTVRHPKYGMRTSHSLSQTRQIVLISLYHLHTTLLQLQGTAFVGIACDSSQLVHLAQLGVTEDCIDYRPPLVTGSTEDGEYLGHV